MPEWAERRRLLVAWSVVLGVAIAHRLALFLLHRADLDALIEANAGYYIFQYLPREMLRDHLLRAMVLLQQTPPVPNLIVGLALKAFSWPAGVAKALMGLQSLVSILTAAVLGHLLSVLYPRRVVLWTMIGLLFVLNTDLVVFEYVAFGQIIYEPLGMLGALVIVDVLVELRRTGRRRWAAAAGIASGLLVLARATWYLFPIPLLLLVAALAPERRASAVLACLVPILVLQGGWTLKNYAVYGVVSPTTSSLGGYSTGASLLTAGLREEFEEFRAAHSPRVPLPPGTGDRDRAVERALGLTNPPLNRLSTRHVFAKDQLDFFRFVRAHPGAMLRKCWDAYNIFWQPIANYGGYLVALFVVSDHIKDPFDFPDIIGQLLAGTLPDAQYVASGSHWVSIGQTADERTPYRVTPTSLYTLRWMEPFALMLKIIGVHLLLPIVGVLWVARRVRRGRAGPPVFDPLRMTALLAAATVYGYLASFVNLVEMSENMRYRLEVEPVIWVITLICVTELGGLVRGGWPRRRSPCIDPATGDSVWLRADHARRRGASAADRRLERRPRGGDRASPDALPAPSYRPRRPHRGQPDLVCLSVHLRWSRIAAWLAAVLIGPMPGRGRRSCGSL
jgi:hypothetical protein